MPITTYECLLISIMSLHRASNYLDALKDDAKITHERREKYLRDYGWKQLITSEEHNITAHGYFGVAYYRINSNGTAEVAFGHRGTCFGLSDEGKGNVLADIEIAQQKQPKILTQAAYLYVDKILPNPTNGSGWEIEGIPITHITHTGFSLGAYIAGACTARFSTKYVYATTFDGPGISPIVAEANRAQVARRITNYVATPNLVNTCNIQVGQVHEMQGIFALHPKESVKFETIFTNLVFAPSPLSSSKRSRSNFNQRVKETQDNQHRVKSLNIAQAELTTTHNSHSLESIISHVERNNEILRTRAVQQWPSANNTFIYGPEPTVPDKFYGFKTNNWAGAFFNALSIAVQTCKTALVSMLWELTKHYNADGELVGVIGIKHNRSNKIEYLPTAPSAQLMVIRSDSLFAKIPVSVDQQQVHQQDQQQAAQATLGRQ